MRLSLRENSIVILCSLLIIFKLLSRKEVIFWYWMHYLSLYLNQSFRRSSFYSHIPWSFKASGMNFNRSQCLIWLLNIESIKQSCHVKWIDFLNWKSVYCVAIICLHYWYIIDNNMRYIQKVVCQIKQTSTTHF